MGGPLDGAPTPTLLGGSDDEAASTDRCGQERLGSRGLNKERAMNFCDPTGGPRSLSPGPRRNGRQARGGPTSTRCFRPRRCRPGLRGRSARPAWALPGGCGISANNCAASMRTFTAPTQRGPVQHPGVVLDAVPSTAHGACLGCQWLDVRGHWMGHSDWFERASAWPHRHQVSNGVFLDGPRRWRGGRFDPP